MNSVLPNITVFFFRVVKNQARRNGEGHVGQLLLPPITIVRFYKFRKSLLAMIHATDNA